MWSRIAFLKTTFTNAAGRPSADGPTGASSTPHSSHRGFHEHAHLRSRHRDHRPHHARVRGNPDARRRSRSLQDCSARSAAAAPSCSPTAQARQAALDAGKLPDFLPETRAIRDGDWTCAPVPADIQDRRTEITGPVDRKMIINALNSGAKVFMADFEDANTPKWDNNIQGQINLRDAIRRRIDYVSPEGKAYKLNDRTATLFVRARGWHLPEKHVRVDGQPMSGGIFDFALYFFHNAKELLARGTGPYFYLPKMESHLEARLWNDIFVMAQDELGVPRGTIKATVLIETILAAFEMDEILYELREHSAGLNCGRWDYIFSCIKKFRNNRDFCLADRALVTMTTHFMKSYAELCVKTCHRRNIHAMGGMAAQIPVKNDEAANAEAFAKVRADKEREATIGHDGTWVAHPGLVPVALEAFDRLMPAANQIATKKRADVHVTRGRPAQVRARAADHREGRAPQHQRRDPVHRRVARRAGRGADLQPDGGRGHRRDLALAGVAVDPLAEGRARRRPQGDEGDGRRDDPRGDGEDPRAPRPGVRRRTLRRGGDDLRRPGQQRHVRRVPDAAGVRADRLSEAREAPAERRREAPGRRAMEDGRRPMVAALQQRCKEAD